MRQRAENPLELNPIARLNRDLREGARTLGDKEARFLVDSYYIIQEDRKRSAAQERSLEASSEPHSVISWFFEQNETLEKQIAVSLDIYTQNHLMGSWMRQIYGIGPVISAGLLAHIDITQCPTAGHIWHFAGIAGPPRTDFNRHANYRVEFEEGALDPNDPPILKLANGGEAFPYYPDGDDAYIYQYSCGNADAPEAISPDNVTSVEITYHEIGQRTWEKSQKRPWNAKLKTLCWKTGQSFMKFSNKDECFYGKLYREKKELYVDNNNKNLYADNARERATKVGKSTEAYKWYSEGKFPPGHIDAMARRYAVKMFLSHLHEVWYWRHFKVDPPKPFAIAILGHVHYIPPPVGR